jgi:hypothetical protein
VIFDQPRSVGMPQRWEAQKPILPTTNSSAASAGQGTVNCPDVTAMLTWSVLMTSYKPHRLVRVVFDQVLGFDSLIEVLPILSLGHSMKYYAIL